MALARLAGPLSFQKGHKLHLSEIGRILGRSPAELVTLAIATYAPALVTPAPQFATTVDAGDSRPQRPDVETGQGTSRRPAPTIYDESEVIAQPIPHIHHSSRTCVYGDRCGQ